MKFKDGVNPYRLGDLIDEEHNKAGHYQLWQFLDRADAELVYAAADTSEKVFSNPRREGGPYEVKLGISQDEIDEAEEFRAERRERMGGGIPPVSDYAHWNEDAEAIWYLENRYDMEHPEVFDDAGY